MIEKIKVVDFVNEYNNCGTEDEKMACVYKIMTRRYASFVEKTTLLKGMSNKATYEKNGIRYVDEISNYINFVFTVLSLHTKLEFKADNRTIFDDYDSLQSNRLISIIFGVIGTEEIEEMSMLNDMIKKQITNEEQNVVSGISNQVTRFSYLVGEKINGSILQLVASIEKIDDKKLNKIKDYMSSITDNFKSITK